MTHVIRHRAYASGLWRHGTLVGSAAAGAGVSILPAHSSSRGEAVVITLNRA